LGNTIHRTELISELYSAKASARAYRIAHVLQYP